MAVREEKWNVDKPTQNNSRFRDGSKMKKTLRRNKENTSKLYVIGPTEPIFHYYRLGEAIGHPGQFGRAREAVRIKDNFKVAVKIIAKSRFRHLKNVDVVWNDLRTEIELLRIIKHPNIVKLFDVYEDKFNLFLVMEHLGGGELYDRIVERHRYHETDAKDVLLQMLQAVSYLHSKRIIHADLKPDNFLFDTEDNLKVIDFGMSKKLPRMRFLHDLVGTPYYTAPEVIEGNYTHSADCWSIGVIMFVILYGYPPFYVDPEEYGHLEHQEIFKQIRQGFIPEVRAGMGAWFPSEIEVSDEARDLMEKLLSFNPEDRPTPKEVLSHAWFTDETAGEKTESTEVPTTVMDSLNKFRKTCLFSTQVCVTFMDCLRSDEYENATQAFLQMDTNGDGKVSFEEFRNALLNTTSLTEEKAHEMFGQVDLNEDHSISYRELVTALTFEHIRAADERLYVTFCELDVDNDGYIDAQELMYVMKRHKVKTGSKTPAEIIATADLNNDGHIDFQEFLQAIYPELYGDLKKQYSKKH